MVDVAETLTFCFTDIEGSTRMLRALGPQGYEAVQDRMRAILRESWAKHGGEEVRAEGDGGFVAFASAGDAVASCVEAQLTLAAADWPAELKVRMGAHTGEANRTPDGDFVGLAVHIAARVSAAANGGQVLITEATADAARTLPDFAGLNDLGSFNLRDVDEPTRLYAVEHTDLPSDPRPPRAPSSVIHNLPIIRTSFVGRDDEMKELAKLIVGTPLLTVLGTGGVGKTRLAIEAATRVTGAFEDGTWLVELAPVTDPELVPSRVASALKIPDDPSRPATDVICDHLRERTLLLLLDNCEHVIDAVADLVDAALKSSPQLTVLATSREPLRIRGETTWAVPALEQDEATQLFDERAADAGATDLDPDAVTRVCERLEGSPLAIELAAARLRTLPLDHLESSLNDRLEALVGGYRTDMPRQQALRATIEWSYALLDDEEKRVLRTLSVFRGGATPAALRDVCGENAEKTMGSLMDKSLVVPGDGRYLVLETISQYAGERLDEAGETDAARERHRGHFMTVDPSAILTLIRDLDNVRRALAYRSDRKMLELVNKVAQVWFRYGPYDEGARWISAALEANPEPSDLRADVLHQLAGLLGGMGHADEAIAAVDEALAWYRNGTDTWRLANALYSRAEAALAVTDFDTARPLLDEVLALDVGDGNTEMKARCEYALSQIALVEARFDDSIDHARRSVEGFTAMDEGHYVATATLMLARAEQAAGRLDEAREHFRFAMAEHGAAGDRSSVAFSAWQLGSLEVAAGNFDAGLAHLEEAYQVGEELADANVSLILAHIAHAKYLRGRKDEARKDISDAIGELERIAHPFGIPYALIFAADIAIMDGDLDAATDHIRRAIHGFGEIGDRGAAAGSIVRIATIKSLHGEHEEAVRLFAAGMTTSAGEADFELIPGIDMQGALDRSREALGAEAEAAWEAGAALSEEEATAEALGR